MAAKRRSVSEYPETKAGLEDRIRNLKSQLERETAKARDRFGRLAEELGLLDIAIDDETLKMEFQRLVEHFRGKTATPPQEPGHDPASTHSQGNGSASNVVEPTA